MLSRAKASAGGTRGFIVPIGLIGGDGRRIRHAAILRRFAQLCGGSRAHIGIISTASETQDAGYRYERAFRDLAGARANVLKMETRADCESEQYLNVLDNADGVFLLGNDPVRVSETLGNTSVAQKIRMRNAQGMHVAGTSAGAAFLPEQMIAAGQSGTTPRADIVQLAPGLGLIGQLIIDQHFRHQDRLGRLLMALTYNPLSIGIGLDEDTAAFIGPDHTLQAVGSGGITVVDPSGLQHSAIHPDRRHAPVSVIGLHLDILVDGCLFDLAAHAASIKR
jgi:cyanophycinase